MTEMVRPFRRGNNASILGVGALISVFLFFALLMATFAKDAGMEYQALTFLALGGTFLLGIVLWAGGLVDRDPFDESEYEDTLIKFGTAAAMFWGLRSAHLPDADRRRPVALVRILGLPDLHRARRDRLFDGHYPI